MRCKTCYYSLEHRGGLTEHRCPECGHEFDPDDPKTFDTEEERMRSPLQPVAIVVGFYFAFWIGIWFLVGQSNVIVFYFVLFSGFIFACVVFAFVVHVIARRLTR